MYEFANPYYPSLPAVSMRSSTYINALDRVYDALAAVLVSPAVESNDKQILIGYLAQARSPIEI